MQTAAIWSLEHTLCLIWWRIRGLNGLSSKNPPVWKHAVFMTGISMWHRLHTILHVVCLLIKVHCCWWCKRLDSAILSQIFPLRKGIDDKLKKKSQRPLSNWDRGILMNVYVCVCESINLSFCSSKAGKAMNHKTQQWSRNKLKVGGGQDNRFSS